MDNKKMGKLIQKKRIEKGYTQKQLANILFITEQAISKWERGKSLPDISLLKEICNTLDIDIKEMLDMNNEGKNNNSKKKWIYFLVFSMFFIILIVLSIHFERNDNPQVNECKNNLYTIFVDKKNNRTIYGNCFSKILIDGVDLNFLLNDNFDLDLYLNNMKADEVLWDGGTKIILANDYKIIKCNTINGNKDIIFGKPDMEYESFFCDNSKKDYEKCFYTDYFRIVDIMDYVGDDNNYTFITLDQFQDPNPKIVKIANNLVNDLTIGNYYEFKFYYENPNNYEVNSTYDAFYYYELISIKKTNKLGLELSSSNTCKKAVN